MTTITVLLGVVVLALAALWLMSLVDVLTKPDHYRNGTQLIWVLVLLLSGPVGAVLYQWLGPVRLHVLVDDTPPPDRRARREAIANPWSEEARP